MAGGRESRGDGRVDGALKVEYCYIAPETPHVVLNVCDAVCRAVVAHTAPDDQEGIELLPGLDALL